VQGKSPRLKRSARQISISSTFFTTFVVLSRMATESLS
jgi:hypothetical protein